MSPILMRPVREQLEHDRIIRLLQTRWKRRFDIAINPGDERNASVKVGVQVVYPDLVLTSTERGRQPMGVVEVETTESVNNLEALAQWAILAKTRGGLYLYVPTGVVDLARRLCAEHQITVAELWSFHTIADQLRFAMVHRAPAPAAKASRRAVPHRPRGAARRGTSARAEKRPQRAKAKPPQRKVTRTQKRK